MSIKGDVNKKWTSTEDYRSNYDKIFKKPVHWIFIDKEGKVLYRTAEKYLTKEDALFCEEGLPLAEEALTIKEEE